MRGVLVATCVLLAAAPASAQGWDAVPDERVERTAEHYPETNERGHALWLDRVAHAGGGYLGVGSLQSYSLAASQRAERVVLVDYDPVVTRLHRAMVALIADCDDAACLAGALGPDLEARSAATVAAAVGEGWEADRTVRAFRVHRPLLARRVRELGREDSFVSRPAWYAHLRTLARRGGIVARTADLTGPRTLRAVAEAARREGLRFRVVYLSNAEEYFRYTPRFASNLDDLPHGPDTVVLRTLRDRRLARAEVDSMWHYDVQPLDDLVRRIRAHGYEDSSWIVNDLLSSPAATLEDGTTLLDARVPARGASAGRRWWLEASTPAPPAPRGARGPSRVLVAMRRAMLPHLDPARRARARGLDLAHTGLSRVRPGTLGADPRGGAFVLSGEPTPGRAPTVPEPEWNLQSMLLDALAREVLPALYDRAGEATTAARLRGAPAAHDLYAAYRLRERLLEICPRGARARGALGEATRACRHATRLIRPAPTARARPSWPERRRRIGRSVRGVARETRDDPAAADALVAALGRLATVARTVVSPP